MNFAGQRIILEQKNRQFLLHKAQIISSYILTWYIISLGKPLQNIHFDTKAH